MKKCVFQLVILLTVLGQSAMAAVITVTNLTDVINGNTSSIGALIASDGGDGISYREAIMATNNTNENNTINVSVAGTVVLRSTMENITSEVIIINANGLILDGVALYNFGNVESRICTINDMVFFNGSNPGTGDIFEYTGFGSNEGELFTMNNCVFDSNNSNNSHVFECDDPICILNSCTFINNTGKDIYYMCETFSSLRDCVFENNSVTTQGVYDHQDGYSELIRCLFVGNTADSILIRSGTVDSLLFIINSTFSGNTITGQNHTLFGFEETDPIDLISYEMELINCTVADNIIPVGSSVFKSGINDSLTLKNIIVSNSGDPADYFLNFAGSITSINNLFEGYSGSVPYISNADPLLGPLQDNGGPTFTHALMAGSPAIDEGDISCCPLMDQRSLYRTNSVCDLGAYEFDAASVIPTLTEWGIIILSFLSMIIGVLYIERKRTIQVNI